MQGANLCVSTFLKLFLDTVCILPFSEKLNLEEFRKTSWSDKLLVAASGKFYLGINLFGRTIGFFRTVI
jgi:hypothetical protein